MRPTYYSIYEDFNNRSMKVLEKKKKKMQQLEKVI